MSTYAVTQASCIIYFYTYNKPTVLILCCRVMSYPKMFHLKTTNNYYFMWWVQKTRRGLWMVLLQGVFRGWSTPVDWRCSFIWRLNWRRIISNLTHFIGLIQFLDDCWTEPQVLPCWCEGDRGPTIFSLSHMGYSYILRMGLDGGNKYTDFCQIPVI